MNGSQQKAEYETALATAWRALWRAQTAADGMNDRGAAQDCSQMCEEIRRLQEASLKAGHRKRVTGL